MCWLMDQKQETSQISNNSCMILGIFAICTMTQDERLQICKHTNSSSDISRVHPLADPMARFRNAGPVSAEFMAFS